MAIIMISSASVKEREELAANLSRKTGWPCLSRDNLLDQAREKGIKVGRLEMSVVKAPRRQEKLAREKQVYLAFLTAVLCAEARQGNIIYHGRAGHLLLPGVAHRLRVGLLIPKERRVEEAMRSLGLGRDRAWSYIEQVDEDIGKWFHFVHGVDPKDQGQYDFTLNLETFSVANAAALLCTMAEMPDFQPTPASRHVLANLDLAARAKLRLAQDEETAEVDLGVRAEGGVVTVTYMPRQEEVAEIIPKVLKDLEGCREILCTMAETNILWVQEQFSPETENFDQVIHVAQRWGAAVELLRVIPPGRPGCDELSSMLASTHVQNKKQNMSQAYCGGVEDDEVEPTGDDGGLGKTLEKLVALGRSGGGHSALGGQDKILEAIRTEAQPALVVIGDLFLSKDQSVRIRQTREMALAIRESIKAPVITVSELGAHYLFGRKQAVTLVVLAVALAAIYGLVFHFQAPIVDFMGGEFHQRWKWLTPLVVAPFVPLVAYLYGTATGLLLKLIDID